jgi:sulfur relay (sulfurtransferase) DsrC/TusE family protein
LQLLNPNEKWIEKELRILAKRSALMMGDMHLRSREVVRDSFAMIDFYDADLVQMLKKYKLVKGGDKK